MLSTKKEEVDTSSGDENTERGNWSGKLDFLLSCIGFAVGIGNLWRFPYLCMRNGGGAFLIPYFFFLFFCGIPLFFLELAIGQFSSLSPLSLWKVCPLFKGLGWGMVAISWICCIYYNIIITWVLYFLGKSFTSNLPFASCDNEWNTPSCYTRGGGGGDNATLINSKPSSWNETGQNFTTTAANSSHSNTTFFVNLTSVLADKKKTSAEEFWQYNVLELSSGIHDFGGTRWQLVLCLVASWTIVFFTLIKGVKSSGKVVYVTATVPYLLLTIILVRGLTLPGAMDGVKYYLTPDFNKLKEFQVWGEACLQIFYSLGPAWGGMITFASYNKFNNNCLRDSIIISCMNCGTSFYGGFVIFSVIGFLAHESNLPISEVITSGPGLAFIAYPEAIARLPFSPVWAILFFLMILTLGLDSQFAMFETMVSGFVDEYPRYLKNHKVLFTAATCIFTFLLGLPMTTQAGLYIFQIIDWYCATFSVLTIAFLEAIVLSWIYGVNRLCYDIEMMIGKRPGRFWRISWMFTTPICLLVIIIFSSFKMSKPSYGSYTYPGWAIGIGWCIGFVSIVPLPILAIIELLKQKGSLKQRIIKSLQPAKDWGPAMEKHRRLYKYMEYNDSPLKEYSSEKKNLTVVDKA